MSERDDERDGKRGDPSPREPDGKAANTAPDAVKDPSEKTDGKPGEGGSGSGETDPGAG